MSWTTLLEGSGGGAAGSGFDPRIFDLLGEENGSLLQRRGTAIFHETFDAPDAFGGFHNHWSGGAPVAPVGKSNMITWGSRSSLLLSPSRSDRIPETAARRGTSIYKRMSRPLANPGVVSFSAMIAVVGSSSYDIEQPPFSHWGISMDSQRWDNTSRMFPRLNCTNMGDMDPQWGIWSYARPSSGTPATWGPGDRASGGNTPIPGAKGISAGLNERKMNPNYVRLTYDFGGGPDGIGGYVEAQINNRVFDLRGLLPSNRLPWDNVLQGDSLDDFRGGFNFGISVYRRSDPVAEVGLVIGQTMATFGDSVNY